MGEAVHGARLQADLPQCVGDQLAPFVIAAAFTVDQQAFLDDLSDGHARAQRRERILEDDLHLPAQWAQDLATKIFDTLAVETDGALARDQAQQRQSQRGLARAAFPHHAHGVAFADLQTDLVHRADMIDGTAKDPGLNGEPDLEIFRRDHGGGIDGGRGRFPLGLRR